MPGFRIRSLFLHPCRSDHEPYTLDIFAGGIAGSFIGGKIIQRQAVIRDLSGAIRAFEHAEQASAHACPGDGRAIHQQWRPIIGAGPGAVA